METQAAPDKPKARPEAEGITKITVAGFKSLVAEQSIEVRPLTILAGANSSGKSSIMQPLLLLKQTLEVRYDPGPLLLNGANVKFTAIDQLLATVIKGKQVEKFSIELEVNLDITLKIYFKPLANDKITIERMDAIENGRNISFNLGMKHEEILPMLDPLYRESSERVSNNKKQNFEWEVIRDRCFLIQKYGGVLTRPVAVAFVEPSLFKLIHLPGWRGNPQRNYPTAAAGALFPGTFENYFASVILQWQNSNSPKLDEINDCLKKLALTSSVRAKAVNAVEIELLVNRMPVNGRNSPSDMVSIADVGLGVSQTLPVLVALLVAEPGQLVYLEQPEIHLHPNAQFALAEILANAAKRGVRVVVETHSDLLILGVQTLIAEGKFEPSLVKLHWFERQKNGSTKISSADLDEAGRFGDWPEDFARISLNAQSRYLDAAESRLMKNSNGKKEN